MKIKAEPSWRRVILVAVLTLAAVTALAFVVDALF
jgi:hypothetical protein